MTKQYCKALIIVSGFFGLCGPTYAILPVDDYVHEQVAMSANSPCTPVADESGKDGEATRK